MVDWWVRSMRAGTGKALFGSYAVIDFERPAGIVKKIAWQAKAFARANGCEAYCQFIAPDAAYVVKPDFTVVVKKSLPGGARHRPALYAWLSRWMEENSIGFLYFRFDHYDVVMHSFFTKVKRFGAEIVLELPTYPYAGERDDRHKKLLEKRKFLAYAIRRLAVVDENIHLKMIKNRVDRIVTYMPHESIWGITVVQIDNGVDLEDTPVTPVRQGIDKNSTLTMACVANLSSWHGLDRLIEGIARYDGVRPVKLLVVGPETNEMDKCRSAVEDLALQGSVEFLGSMGSSELDALFMKVDIAVGSLGLHRIGLAQGSTLKVKEYCARGIPFIYSYDEARLSGEEDFALKLPADDDAIDVEKVVNFADGLPPENKLRGEMREFAEDFFSWDSQMAIVLDSCMKAVENEG